MLRIVLVCAAALASFGLIAFAQNPGEKKADVSKGKDDADKAKPKTPIDQIKLPNNAIIIIVDDLLKATSMIPKQAVIPFEKWLEDQERIKALERTTRRESARRRLRAS